MRPKAEHRSDLARAAVVLTRLILKRFMDSIRTAQRETRPIIATEVFRKLAADAISSDGKNWPVAVMHSQTIASAHAEVKAKPLLSNVQFTAEALRALQSATEGHVIKLLEASNRAAFHASRYCIEPKDLQLVQRT
eukprot:SAG22_NODE_1835_length_3468_cov_3.304541_2_plen_136_part_00